MYLKSDHTDLRIVSTFVAILGPTQSRRVRPAGSTAQATIKAGES
jgi:hypothetical protein